MKKIIFNLVITIILTNLSFGQNGYYSQRKVTDQTELQNIINYTKRIGSLEKSFNFNDLTIVSLTIDASNEVIVINDINFDDRKPENQSLTISYKNRVLDKIIYVKTKKVNSTTNIAEYSNLNSEILFSMNLNIPAKEMKVLSRRGCGQLVADCVNDLYTNHGWISVWAMVQTTFLPQTLAVAIIACWDRFC